MHSLQHSLEAATSTITNREEIVTPTYSDLKMKEAELVSGFPMINDMML
jgi:hypothetical protein